MRTLPLLCLLLLACGEEQKEDSGNGSLNPADTAPDCMGTPPAIEDLTAQEGGIISGSDGEDDAPSILLIIDFTDEDGDAHVLAMDIWFDDTIDGTVDTSGAADMVLDPTAMTDSADRPVEECAGDGGSLGLSLGVTGADLAYETTYDFGVVLIDNADLRSEPAFVTATTPPPL